MSVINNVLKDLERKPTGFTPLDIDTVPGQKKPARAWNVYILLAVLGMLAIVIYRFDIFGLTTEKTAAESALVMPQDKSSGSLVRTPVEKIQLENTKPPASLPAVLPDNEIIGLQIRENEEFMELDFQLIRLARSYLKQRSNNRYIFVIRDVNNAIQRPLISDSPWLKQIQLSSVSEGVEIRFDTQQGVLVDTEDLQNDSYYYWKIRLKKNIQSEAHINQPVPIATKSTDRDDQRLPGLQAKQDVPKRTESSGSVEIKETEIKLKISPVQSQPTAQLRLSRAVELEKSGNRLDAKQQLQGLLGSEVDRKARVHLLDILSDQNDIEGFSRLLISSLQVYPDEKVLLLLDANRLFAQKQYQILVERYKDRQNNMQLFSLLATSYQRLEQHQLATEKFISALKIKPQQPRLWISLAISQQHLAQRSQALNSYKTALRSGSLNQRLHDFVQDKIRQLSN